MISVGQIVNVLIFVELLAMRIKILSFNLLITQLTLQFMSLILTKLLILHPDLSNMIEIHFQKQFIDLIYQLLLLLFRFTPIESLKPILCLDNFSQVSLHLSIIDKIFHFFLQTLQITLLSDIF